MTLQDCFDNIAERVKYFSCATRDIEPSSIAFTELSDPTRLWKRRGEPLQYEHCHEEKGMP